MLWLVVFVDLLGFGVLIPLIPFYAVKLGLTPAWVTFVIALHSLFQFLGAPFLGRLSDRFGRRPVLIISMLGHAAAYLMLGFADSVIALVLSRMLSGFTAGNLATAYAYIVDVCAPEQRARGLARVSSAFALGYALGPMLGGLLVGDLPLATADLHRPAYLAAALSLLSFVTIFFWLPETHHPRHAPSSAVQLLPTRTEILRKDSTLLLMLTLSLTVIVCAAMRESLLALWAHDKHHFDAHLISLLFTSNGLGVAFMQFFVTGWVIQKFGEISIVRIGIVTYGLGWLILVLASSFGWLIVGILFGAIATALFGTSLQSLVAARAAGNTRGTVLGIYQSSSSLARFMGAAVSGSLYGQVGYDAPYIFGAVMMLPALLLTLWIARKLRGQRHS